MLALVIARISFVIGLMVIVFLSGSGVIPATTSAAVVIAFVVLCELFIARPLKARASPPLTSKQRSFALLPWLLPLLLIALALLVSVFK